VNFADVGDIVAIPRGWLASHFDGVEYDAGVVIGEWISIPQKIIWRARMSLT
jgi:hypothetical protein